MSGIADLNALLSLDVSPGVDGEPAVVTASGEIDIASVPPLDACLATLVDASSSVVLDLAKVSFIDSTGLGVLVKTRKRATSLGCKFSLRHVAPNVAKTVALGGLDGVFDIES